MLSEPDKITVIEPNRSWSQFEIGEIWRYRELLIFLTWRNIKVRYKQSIIGIGWAILQPLLSMIVISMIFGNFLGISSDGVPYAPFALAALVPWRYFSTVIIQGNMSVVGNAHMITKVYFPRLILPIVALLDPLVDMMIAMVLLMFVLFSFGISLSFNILLLPVFILLAMLCAFGLSLWSSAMNVRYRDVGRAIPFLVQILMYLSPVIYSASSVPEQWQSLFRLNPVTSVIDGFRWALLGTVSPDLPMLAISWIVVVLLVVTGLAFFNRTQDKFADVI